MVGYPPGATVDTGAFNPASTEWEVAYEFTYDALDRQKSVQQWTRLKDDADGSSQTILSGTTTYHFDAEGRLAKLDTPQGYLVYMYDSTGRLVGTQVAQSADVNGQPAGPISLGVGYTYDSLGRLKTVTRGSGKYTYTYNRAGSRESLSYSSDGGATVQILTQYEYDSLNRLERLTHWDETVSPPEILSQYEYTLRPDGRRAQVVDTRRESGSTLSEVTSTYDYDAIGRLRREASAVTSPNGSRVSGGAYDYTHEYFFDKSGNRTRKIITEPGLTSPDWIAYSYYDGGKDRLFQEVQHHVDAGTTTITEYDYNLNGFLTRKTADLGGLDEKTHTYLPNAEDRLAAAYITENGTNGPAVFFTYDVNGSKTRRYETTTNINDFATLVSSSLIDSNNHTGYAQTIQERNAAGAATRSYVIGDDMLSQTVGSTTDHLLYDGHGSTRVLVDAAASQPSAAINGRFDYDAYGNAIGFDAEVAATNLLYTGEQVEQSEQVAMYYLRARWYDPTLGRLSRIDPYRGSASYPTSFHRYLYAAGDPVLHVDPTGEFSVVEAIAISALLFIAGTILTVIYTAEYAQAANVSRTDAFTYIGPEFHDPTRYSLGDPEILNMELAFARNLAESTKFVHYQQHYSTAKTAETASYLLDAADLQLGMMTPGAMAGLGMRIQRGLPTHIVLSKPHVPGVHWDTMLDAVKVSAETGTYEAIYTNRALQVVTRNTSHGEVRGLLKADLSLVRGDGSGKIDFIEVLSPSNVRRYGSKFDYHLARRDELEALLGNDRMGHLIVLDRGEKLTPARLLAPD